jgi:hypothetical protein
MADEATNDKTQEQAAPQVKLDDSNVAANYANFCRISGTPEELVLDFALNPQSTGRLPEVLTINQRVILNFYTAKRLLGALHQAVHRHEQAFGSLEIDFRKRVTAPPADTTTS